MVWNYIWICAEKEGEEMPIEFDVGDDRENVVGEYVKICPICGSKMDEVGRLKMKNLASGRYREVQAYNCKRCGYRTIG